MYYNEAEALYIKAKETNDETILREFCKFGNDEHHMIENYASYDQYRLCGYTNPPVFNEYGWCKNDIPKEDIQVLPLWNNGYVTSSINFALLPNGKWVSGYDYMLSESGAVSGSSKWDTQYSSKFEAIKHSLAIVEDAIRRSKVKSDLDHLTEVSKARLNYCQPTLF